MNAGGADVNTDGQADEAFLFFRDESDRQHITSLPVAKARVTVGRGDGSDVCLSWDNEVSRLHAQLEHVGSDWVLVDDGLSRNGTYLNGERLRARHRLRDGDVIVVGSSAMTYRDGNRAPSPETHVAQNVATMVSLTDTQRLVLRALCRPYKGVPYATPATNQQIAAETYLSVDGVKNHLRTLFHKFGVEDLPQNQNRTRLVELAFRSGLVSERTL